MKRLWPWAHKEPELGADGLAEPAVEEAAEKILDTHTALVEYANSEMFTVEEEDDEQGREDVTGLIDLAVERARQGHRRVQEGLRSTRTLSRRISQLTLRKAE